MISTVASKNFAIKAGTTIVKRARLCF